MERDITQVVDLLTQTHYSDYEAEFLARNYEHTEKHPTLDLKKGDVVEFWSGFHNDIRYRTKILGFDPEGKAYMFWDCFWYAIRLDEREYKKVQE